MIRKKMKDYLFYADPCQLFDYCKQNFSKQVALLHDYRLYEFTIICEEVKLSKPIIIFGDGDIAEVAQLLLQV